MIGRFELNKIYNEDCVPAMREMPDKCFDLVVTDIPYGEVNRKSNGLRNLHKGLADIVTFDLSGLVDELCRVCKGSIYIFCGTEQVSIIRQKMVENGLSTRLCVWEKTNPSPMNGQHIWLSGVECCVFGKFKNATFNEHCKNTVFRYPSGRCKLHPTQKPIELIKRLILASSNEGDIVFDPFMGSGTTAAVAQTIKRKYLGFELDSFYYDVSQKRLIDTEFSQPSFFENQEWR